MATTRSHQGFPVDGNAENSAGRQRVTGNPTPNDKTMRERMPAAGYERANIGYNEMPALI